MKMSTKGRYAVLALIELAETPAESPVLLSYLANRQSIPERYLIQIFSSLRKAGLVRSFRGAKGGFQLARPVQEITLADIVEAAEGPIGILDCLQDHYAECRQLDSCALREIWQEVNKRIKTVFQDLTLAAMVQKDLMHKLQGQRNYQI